MQLHVDLDILGLFRQPKTRWDIHKESYRVYSMCWKLVEKYLELGLIKKVGERPSRKNPWIITKTYLITAKGERLLQIFEEGEDQK